MVWSWKISPRTQQPLPMLPHSAGACDAPNVGLDVPDVLGYVDWSYRFWMTKMTWYSQACVSHPSHPTSFSPHQPCSPPSFTISMRMMPIPPMLSWDVRQVQHQQHIPHLRELLYHPLSPLRLSWMTQLPLAWPPAPQNRPLLANIRVSNSASAHRPPSPPPCSAPAWYTPPPHIPIISLATSLPDTHSPSHQSCQHSKYQPDHC